MFKRVRECSVGDIAISSITHSELQFGVAKSRYLKKNQLALQAFLASIVILDYPQSASRYYGHTRAHLEKQGETIGALDLLIAAHALSLKTTLVTNNTIEFKRVPQLRIENWAN